MVIVLISLAWQEMECRVDSLSSLRYVPSFVSDRNSMMKGRHRMILMYALTRSIIEDVFLSIALCQLTSMQIIIIKLQYASFKTIVN